MGEEGMVPRAAGQLNGRFPAQIAERSFPSFRPSIQLTRTPF